MTLPVTFLMGCALAFIAAFPARAQLAVVDPRAISPEGPVWLGGALFYVEYGNADIKRWDGASLSVTWKSPNCGPTGLFPYGDTVSSAAPTAITISRRTDRAVSW